MAGSSVGGDFRSWVADVAQHCPALYSEHSLVKRASCFRVVIVYKVMAGMLQPSLFQESACLHDTDCGALGAYKQNSAITLLGACQGNAGLCYLAPQFRHIAERSMQSTLSST